jgi:hypothetical protein
VSLTLQEVITAARDKHPAFDKTRVPNAVLARVLTDYQRQLVVRSIPRNKRFLAQRVSILMSVEDENVLEQLGAGESGTGAIEAIDGDVETTDIAGLAITLDTSAILVDDIPVTSATGTTLYRAAAGWTIDAFQANAIVLIRAGKGAGQRRDILSNSDDTLSISTGSDGLEWETIPDETSIFRVVDARPQAGPTAVVTHFPMVRDTYGYVVKLNDSGVPYIDLTAPLVGKLGVGIPLPPHHLVLPGTVYPANVLDAPDPFELMGPRSRFECMDSAFSGYVEGGLLFLNGTKEDWRGTSSVEVPYVPIPPALSRLDSLFLVPDSAYSPLVAAAAQAAAERASSHEGVQIDVSMFADKLAQAEATWMLGVSSQRSTRKIFTRS